MVYNQLEKTCWRRGLKNPLLWATVAKNKLEQELMPKIESVETLFQGRSWCVRFRQPAADGIQPTLQVIV